MQCSNCDMYSCMYYTCRNCKSRVCRDCHYPKLRSYNEKYCEDCEEKFKTDRCKKCMEKVNKQTINYCCKTYIVCEHLVNNMDHSKHNLKCNDCNIVIACGYDCKLYQNIINHKLKCKPLCGNCKKKHNQNKKKCLDCEKQNICSLCYSSNVSITCLECNVYKCQNHKKNTIRCFFSYDSGIDCCNCQQYQTHFTYDKICNLCLPNNKCHFKNNFNCRDVTINTCSKHNKIYSSIELFNKRIVNSQDRFNIKRFLPKRLRYRLRICPITNLIGCKKSIKHCNNCHQLIIRQLTYNDNCILCGPINKTITDFDNKIIIDLVSKNIDYKMFLFWVLSKKNMNFIDIFYEIYSFVGWSI